MSDLLYSEDFGKDENPTFICLHGLLGSSRNWRSVAKAMGERFHVFALDLRNHGQSFHSDNSSITSISEDILQWMKEKEIENSIFCGHSLGGKVAMKIACDHPNQVNSLIVVDIAPRNYPKDHHIPTFDALLGLDLPSIRTRKDADQGLEVLVPNWAFRQFLLTNLGFNEDGAFWIPNLLALRSSIEDLSSNPLKEFDRFVNPSLFVRGGRSGYVRGEHFEEILHHFPAASIETIEEVGHDVHVENRPQFVQLVNSFLEKNFEG